MLALEDLANLSEKEVIAHIISEYEAPSDAFSGVKLLIAYESVGNGGCDSSSFFLFRKGGKLYEVNGDHCSCYGFEGQWEPEETSKAALERRTYISLGGYDEHPNENREAIKKAISKLRNRA